MNAVEEIASQSVEEQYTTGEQSQEEKVFPRFQYPAPKGHCQFPNDWFDEICSQIDNVAELKVVMYVHRHTYGFQKKNGTFQREVFLTVDDYMLGRTKRDGDRMDRGTGMSEMSVRNGVKKAIKHGYISCRVDDRDKARIKKYYSLNFREAEVQDLGDEVQSLDPEIDSEVQSLEDEVNNLDLERKSLDLEAIDDVPRTEKETLKTQSTKTDEKESDTSSHQLKPDSFLALRTRQIVKRLGSTNKLSGDIAWMKAIYQAAIDIDQATFLSHIEDIAKDAENRSLELLRNNGFEDKMHYFLCCLAGKVQVSLSK